MNPVAAGWRLHVASSALLVSMLGLPLATVGIGSRALFQPAAWLNMGFILLLLPEVIAATSRGLRQPMAKLALLGGLVLLIAWQLLHGGFWGNARMQFLLTLPLYGVALREWFRSHGDAGLLHLSAAKLLMLLVGIVWVCALPLLARHGLAEMPRFGPTPMFRHVRNMNDELPWAMALAALLLSLARRPLAALFLLPALAAFGYFTVWSGSRGQLLSMALLTLVLLACGALPWRQRTFQIAVAATVVGAVVALAIGEGDRFAAMVGRSSGESVSGFSSGRDLIWRSAVAATLASPGALIFGCGPDAFALLRLDAEYKAMTGPIIQPHNTLVLWGLEFGLLGLAILLALLALALRLAWRQLHRSPVLDVRNVAAALVIAQIGFSMFTGIAYHSMPMIFMLILIAFLSVPASTTTEPAA